jgi:hypothetical protein
MDEILKASQMITERTMMPGDPGSKKWIKQYGDKLICIRYRYDAKRKMKVKTVELIVEEKQHQFNCQKIPHNKKVQIRVKYGEIQLGQLVREAGGIWNKDEKVWELPYGQVKALGLANRMVR